MERARHGDVGHVRQPAVMHHVDGAAPERLQPRATLRRRALEERRTDHVRSSGHGDAHGQPRVERHDDVGGVLRRHLEVLVSADARQEYALAVDRDLDLVRLLEPADGAHVRVEQLHLDDVLAVERKVVLRHQAAAGAERQPFDVLDLRRVSFDAIDLGAGANRRVANGERADLRRRREVAFEERRRDAEQIGVVVEARGRIVRRQQMPQDRSPSARRSRIALPYSVRFSRCKAGPP